MVEISVDRVSLISITNIRTKYVGNALRNIANTKHLKQLNFENISQNITTN